MERVVTKRVCVECFEDTFLRTQVANRGTPLSGECEFCYAINQQSLPAAILGRDFDRVVSALALSDSYAELRQQAGTGEELGYLLQAELGFFSESVSVPQDLANAILEDAWTERHPDDDYPDLWDTWILRNDDWAAERLVESVDVFVKEVEKLGLAYHPGPGKPIIHNKLEAQRAHEHLRSGLQLMSDILEAGATVYRARADVDKSRWSKPEEYLPPPPRLAQNGRASLAGEPVWYLAREKTTAMSEVRKGGTSAVTVAEWTTQSELKLCCLSRAPFTTSPFESLEQYQKERDIADVASNLGHMFSLPIDSENSNADYTTTQQIARMIRELGFDGISYDSSQSQEGLNYLLFDPQCSLGFVKVHGPIEK